MKKYLLFATALTFSFNLNGELRSPDSDKIEALENEFEKYDPDLEVQSTMSQEEIFHRVPLTPPMSAVNWKKWAGPMFTKRYTIRRGDTLWGISEKLFGTPYLWPKIWQLNANFGNAHLIEKGAELRFTPGNPNAAPGLAYDKAKEAEYDYGNIDFSFEPPTLLERLEYTLKAQSDGKYPPFRSFLLTDRLKTVGAVPGKPDGRRLYEGGETFKTNVKDGTYSVVRWERFKKISGFRAFWLGVVNVIDGEATISKRFAEIRQGDLISPRLFLLSPLAIHESDKEKDRKGDFQVIPIQDGYRTFSGQYMTVGLRYKYDNVGPQLGALVDLVKHDEKVGKALIVDRDRRSATMWVIENYNEIDGAFEIQ